MSLEQNACEEEQAHFGARVLLQGRGFAMPADIQLVDARDLSTSGVAVLQPMRDVSGCEAGAGTGTIAMGTASGMRGGCCAPCR
jgi:hypothetical protein